MLTKGTDLSSLSDILPVLCLLQKRKAKTNPQNSQYRAALYSSGWAEDLFLEVTPGEKKTFPELEDF